MMPLNTKLSDFNKLVIANSLSTAGDSATSLAILLYISQQTGRAEPVVYLALIMALPKIFALLIPGHFLDKLPKRPVLLICEILNALLTLLSLGAIFSANYIWLFPLLFLKSAVTSIYNPVRSSLLPSLVSEDRLMEAYAKLNTSNTIASVVGTAISGALIATNGNYWLPLSIDILSFLASFFLLFKISKMPGEIEDETIDWRSASSGLSIIQGNSTLTTALLFGISLTISLEFYNVLYVPLLAQVFKAPAYWFSLVEAVQAIAILLSGIVVARLPVFNKKHERTAVFAAIVLGCSVAAMGIVDGIYLFTLAIFIMGASEIPLSASMQTMIQTQLTENIRVRVAASINGSIAFAEIIGLLLCLLLINIISIESIFIISGCGILLISFFALLRQTSLRVVGETK